MASRPRYAVSLMWRFIVWSVVNKFRDLAEVITDLFDVTGICVGGEMAIDLFCYLSMDNGAVKSALVKISSKYSDIFRRRFIISPSRDADFVLKEIAAKYGVVAESFFMVSLRDKDSANLIPTVSRILDYEFNGLILILQDNEYRR
ncbi:hypothetical protein BCEN4_1090145 [Burkholderia cenocepacia]|uniref:hypothetical protein n=1 Tax=Burkholderia cenocepacia TaxID=95486 RepID=UPI00192CAF10|nr:hypothetical protein [Burkholderia cenocepacia]CAD9217565.1 hypothetical protein BCEN4_1090145 [Burkholderia cenocepacia]